MAVTEFMVGVTGLRKPQGLLNYYGHRGIMTCSKADPAPDCYYCKGVRGTGTRAGVERFLGSDRDDLPLGNGPHFAW